ncbi:MAG: glutathione-disulfide reductase [Deltaproteobacteria bacterium]|nr:glutathione-disulfide reductase [Nannocystaceae bacterium]
MSYDFDLLTIGAGSGGVAASRRASSHGAKVAICEERDIGGTCVLRGCVPKKLLVYASSVRDDLACARGFGWHIPDASVDWAELITAKQAELRRLESIYEKLLTEGKVTTLRGRARIVDAHTVEIGGERHSAARILVATGGRPWVPEIPGAELGMTSEGALDRTDVPSHVTIVGAGYIAVEFAGIFHGAGAAVTVLSRGDGVLRGFDEDLRKHLDDEMTRRGIEIRRHAELAALEAIGERLCVRTGADETFGTDAVLFATGRVPNSDGLGLEECGVVRNGDGAIVVDEWSRTNVPSIFAVGDVTARPQLTPMAIADGRAFADSELGGKPRTVAHEHVATAVFSQPPCATVGLTEAEARARGEVLVYRSRFRPMKHAFAGRQTVTMMKLVVDRDSDRVLGIHMVGPDAPEIIQGFAVAVRCGATKAQLDATLAIHPTAAEELVTMMTPVG